jgi:WD40-like Beta Propeller Repeat
MNGTERLERELTSWFADTATPQTPDWTTDILSTTAAMRQRPRWTFPARWLPAAVVPRLRRRSLRQPVPWRTIAILAVLGLLLAAAVTLYVGSRPRLPAPFGPAVNGLVAYAEDGQIWTVDPVTGERQRIVIATGDNKAPRFSRDGTRLAFLRRVGGGDELAITEADGSGPVESQGETFIGADTDSISWSPDGRSVAVVADDHLGRTTYLVDTTTGEVRDLVTPGVDTEVYWRPPDGQQLMYNRDTFGRQRPFLVSVESGEETEMVVENPEISLRPGGWTPDGKQFVVHRHDHDDNSAWTELLDPETGVITRRDVAFGRVSNDGQEIVGHGMFPGNEADFLCVMPFSGGTCVQIADPRYTPDFEHSAGMQWSPDDRWILVFPRDDDVGGAVLVSPDGGPVIRPVWSQHGAETWQRNAR